MCTVPPHLSLSNLPDLVLFLALIRIWHTTCLLLITVFPILDYRLHQQKKYYLLGSLLYSQCLELRLKKVSDE